MVDSISILPGKKDLPPSVFAPGATTRLAKNRVVGSEVFSYDRTRTTWSQPVEPHREITLTITIIASGRHSFWSMDTFEGINHDPASLHKYLYCQDEPVNLEDPSGRGPFTLTEVAITSGSKGVRPVE